MYRGFYVTANGMINYQKVINTASNNIANSSTAGYRSDKVDPTTFDRRLLLLRGEENTTGTIEYKTVDNMKTDLTQGSFEFTSSRLDMAIDGNVYFNIEGKDGEEMLTRNGQFNLDDEGYLALGTSGRVLGEDGPIQIGTADFAVAEDGTITTSEGDTYKLLLSHIDENGDVIKSGDNLFTSEDAGEIPEGEEYKILQGAYERSNVDYSKEITSVMEAQRSFEACSQALKMIDTINQRTASEIARMQ
ncbi:MAG: flagellar hook-basal body protein [Oscillospiraceae bacterium]